MAYNVQLADNYKNAINSLWEKIKEKKMFGGISFLFNGKMCVGVIKDQLVVRILKNRIEHELNKTNVHQMDFAKRPMKEFVFVDILPNEDMNHWIKLGIKHANHTLNK